MNAALVSLMRLRAKAGWRKVVRTAKRPRGAIMLLVAVGFVALMVVPSMLVPRGKLPSMQIWFFEPEALFLLWLVFSLTGRNANALAFTLPEVEFLFPGPFSRRELIAYKLSLSFLGPLGTALLMPLFLNAFDYWWLALSVGMWLTLVFMQTSSLLANLAAGWLLERIRYWWIAVAAFAAIFLVWLAWQSGALQPGMRPLERLNALRSFPVVQVIVSPFAIFSNMAAAKTYQQLALWAAAGVAASGIVVALVMWVDLNFLEASLRTAERRYKWLQRVQRGGGVPSIGMREKPRFSLSQFPYLWGVGPVAWRQTLDLLRNSSRLLYVLPAIIGMSLPAFFSGQHGLAASVVVAVVFIGFMISMVVPMGLRTDLQHVEVLKTLPAPAGAVVSGSVAAAVAYPTVVQLATVCFFAIFAREWSEICTLAVAFAAPFNLMLVAADSVVVLMYPSTRRFVPGDLLVGVRMMFVYLAKSVFLGVGFGAAALLAAAAYLVVGESPIVLATLVWMVVVAEGAATVWLASLLFERFDPSLESSGEQ